MTAQRLVWFGFAGYPEITRVKWDTCADTRPGHFVGSGLCATVIVGDWQGTAVYPPGDERHGNLGATVAYAKDCVDYQRAKSAK